MTGRPSDYTPELCDSICAQVALGKSLRTICKSEDMPNAATVFRWLRLHPDFCEHYTRARKESTHAMAEEAMDIADEGSNDWMLDNDPDNPGYRVNGEHINRSRLRVDTRKWFLARLDPKKYGDKLDIGNADDKPFQITIAK